mmetsp:Transcript_6104/g.8528  ORF Transcript_6104/g.8528 Transcript_6104/m.8528 type:complete len:107 (+) Transcript_6104:229-549(+)
MIVTSADLLQGSASLGLDMVPVVQYTTDLSTFERARETQRKGVNRIPEADRIRILKQHGIGEETLADESVQLDKIQTSRMLSIISPTDNPLPPEQRELYRNFLFQK